MESLGSYLKGFLFFSGSVLQWPGKDPKQFLYFHGYILIVYFIAFIAGLAQSNLDGLIYTAGAIAPIMFAISKGLPLDCLDYKAAIVREEKSRT